MSIVSYKWSATPGATIAVLTLVCVGAPSIERDRSAITKNGEIEAGGLSNHALFLTQKKIFSIRFHLGVINRQRGRRRVDLGHRGADRRI